MATFDSFVKWVGVALQVGGCCIAGALLLALDPDYSRLLETLLFDD